MIIYILDIQYVPGILWGPLQALQQAGEKQTRCRNNETWPGFIVTGSEPGLLSLALIVLL